MITEKAVVVAVNGDQVTVEASVKSTCNSCQVQSDCGTGSVAKAIAPKTQQLVLRSPLPVNIGDEVTVGLPEAGLMTASAMLYIVPVILLVLSATLLNAWLPLSGWQLDTAVLMISSLITLAGFVFISRKLKQLDQSKFRPVLLKSLSK